MTLHVGMSYDIKYGALSKKGDIDRITPTTGNLYQPNYNENHRV